MLVKNIEEKKQKLLKKIEYWEQMKPLLIAQQDLKEQLKQIKNKYKEQKKALTMSKFLMLFLFISCSIIQFFTLYVTFKSIKAGVYDFSALQMLITAVVGEVVAFAAYSIKSLKENTVGGIVYETAMRQYETSQEDVEE